MSWPAAAVAVAVVASIFGIMSRNTVKREDCDAKHKEVGDSQKNLELTTTKLEQQVTTLFANTQRLSNLVDRQTDILGKFEEIIRRNQR